MMGRPPIQPSEDGILEPSFLFTELAVWVNANISGVIFLLSKIGECGQNVSEVPAISKLVGTL